MIIHNARISDPRYGIIITDLVLIIPIRHYLIPIPIQNDMRMQDQFRTAFVDQIP